MLIQEFKVESTLQALEVSEYVDGENAEDSS